MTLPQPKIKIKFPVEVENGIEYKVCTKCLKRLTTDKFGKYSWKGSYYPRCRECVNEDSKISKIKNKR